MQHTDEGVRPAPSVPDEAGAGQRAEQAASTAKEGAKDVAQTAREQASQVGTEVKEQGRDLANQARSQLRGQADDQTQKIAGKLRELGDEFRALANGKPEQATNVRGYADDAAGKLSELAGRFESRGFDGVVDDMKSFARRRPGAFLAGAAVAGFAVGRLFRNTSGATNDQHGQTPAPVPAVPTSQRTGLVAGPAAVTSGVSSPTTELPTGAV